jgi:hypothetical protein
VPETPTSDERLANWLVTVHRESRRHVDRTTRENQSGPLAIPLRFGYKVLALGPAAAVKLAVGVVAEKVGLR